jgi:hypothetical protein
MIKFVAIRPFEFGLVFRKDVFKGLLGPGE